METVQSRRLCIDGRAVSEFSSLGMLSGELIDQWVSALGEEGTTFDWIEKHRMVLLSHPNQVFFGSQLRLCDSNHAFARQVEFFLAVGSVQRQLRCSIL